MLDARHQVRHVSPTCDDVCGQRHTGQQLARPHNQGVVRLPAVPPPHALQGGGGARLRRHVQLLAYVGVGGNDLWACMTHSVDGKRCTARTHIPIHSNAGPSQGAPCSCLHRDGLLPIAGNSEQSEQCGEGHPSNATPCQATCAQECQAQHVQYQQTFACMQSRQGHVCSRSRGAFQSCWQVPAGTCRSADAQPQPSRSHAAHLP